MKKRGQLNKKIKEIVSSRCRNFLWIRQITHIIIQDETIIYYSLSWSWFEACSINRRGRQTFNDIFSILPSIRFSQIPVEKTRNMDSREFCMRVIQMLIKPNLHHTKSKRKINVSTFGK